MDFSKFASEVEGLQFVEHPSGLQQGLVRTPQAEGSFFLLGGHVASWQPAGGEPVLFLSAESKYEIGQAIRGGVPICFPWFGPKKTGAGELEQAAPSHGLVRTQAWELTQARMLKDQSLQICLEFTLDALRLEYWVTFGRSLVLAMHVHNQGSEVQSPELALHTYFKVADASQVKIHGLEEVGFLNQLSGIEEPASGKAIEFQEETDRIYHGMVDEILLEDPGFNRTIRVLPQGSRSTVIWNPWVAKSQRMPDFGDSEFQRMCCIETACIQPHALEILPGETAVMSVEIAAS